MRSHCDVYVSYSRSQEIADKSHSVNAAAGNSGSGNGYNNGRSVGNGNSSSSTPLANTGSKRPRSPAPSYSGGYSNHHHNSSSASSGCRRDGSSSSYAAAAAGSGAMGIGSMLMPDMINSSQMGGMPVVNSLMPQYLMPQQQQQQQQPQPLNAVTVSSCHSCRISAV
jgi:hypothetical protein